MIFRIKSKRNVGDKEAESEAKGIPGRVKNMCEVPKTGRTGKIRKIERRPV